VVFEAGAVKVFVAMPGTVGTHLAPKGVLWTLLGPRLRRVDRRAEIREFLISRRAKVAPEDADLFVAEHDVRRVPGLRREEVADLAGLSVDYYTQIERGDIAGASDSVLNAVARALRLDDAERLHLFDLARAGIAARLAPSRGVIRPTLQQTLDAFTGGMALVRNRQWDYLAANALGRAVYEEIFDARTGAPNHVRYVFLDERARAFFEDWPLVAQDTARILRSETGRDPEDPGPAALVDEMSQASEEFRDVWSQHDVRLPAIGTHRFHHPRAGVLDLVFVSAALRADPGLTLLLATAEPGSRSEAALRRLVPQAVADR
jgi:transcriptional regulator with XRE-family HTH domain